MNNVSCLCAKLKLLCGAYGGSQLFSKYFGTISPKIPKEAVIFSLLTNVSLNLYSLEWKWRKLKSTKSVY